MFNLILAKKIDKVGSALILTMFIMSGMLLVAMSGAYVVFLGIKAGGIQAQSTKAYYAAEAGAEKFLYKMHYTSDFDYGEYPPGHLMFNGTLNIGPSYEAYFVSWPPLVFRSIGDFQNTKRSVEVRFGD
jgi:hypothetical protein